MEVLNVSLAQYENTLEGFGRSWNQQSMLETAMGRKADSWSLRGDGVWCSPSHVLVFILISILPATISKRFSITKVYFLLGISKENMALQPLYFDPSVKSMASIEYNQRTPG